MCLFSGKIVRVANTRIFARASAQDDGARQLLAYDMTVTTVEDVAMILPIPVRRDAGEDALRFISLSEYDGFFDDLERGFGVRQRALMDTMDAMASRSDEWLAVHDVGLFNASFAPNRGALSRLDPQFRLPESAWERLPAAYDAYGFAVFLLKGFGGPEAALVGATRPPDSVRTKAVHPMAFEFERDDPTRLFFPTIHLHDGHVHELAEFDHTLFAQAHSSVLQRRGRGRGKREPSVPRSAARRSLSRTPASAVERARRARRGGCGTRRATCATPSCPTPR